MVLVFGLSEVHLPDTYVYFQGMGETHMYITVIST